MANKRLLEGTIYIMLPTYLTAIYEKKRPESNLFFQLLPRNQGTFCWIILDRRSEASGITNTKPTCSR